MNFIGTVVQNIHFQEYIYTVTSQDDEKCYVNGSSYTHFRKEHLLRILNGDPLFADEWIVLQSPLNYINIF